MYWKQGRVTILVRVSRDFQHDLQMQLLKYVVGLIQYT